MLRGIVRRGKARVLAVTVAALVLLVVFDWWQTNREMDALLDSVSESEAAMESGRDQIWSSLEDSDLAAMDQAVTPSLEYEQARQELIADIQAISADALAEVRATGAEVEDVSVLPWHGEVREAREAYLEHSEAWVDYLRAIAQDPSKLADGVLGADISATFDIAEERFNDALPFWPRHDAKQRVRDIFVD